MKRCTGTIRTARARSHGRHVTSECRAAAGGPHLKAAPLLNACHCQTTAPARTLAMGGKAGVAKGGVAKPQPAKKRGLQESAAVIDDLFAAIPKRAAREPEPEPEPAPASKPRGRAAAASGQEADGERRPEARRRRQEEYYLDNGEKIVPVRCAAVRRAVQLAAQCLTHCAARRAASRTACLFSSRSTASATLRGCARRAWWRLRACVRRV